MMSERYLGVFLALSLLAHVLFLSALKPMKLEHAAEPPPPIDFGFKQLPPKPPAPPELPADPVLPRIPVVADLPPIHRDDARQTQVEVDPNSSDESTAKPHDDGAKTTDGEQGRKGGGETVTDTGRGHDLSKVRRKASATDPSLHNGLPRYPRAAVLAGVEGEVSLKIWVDNEGRAGAIEVIGKGGHSELIKAAKDTARRWRYLPAQDNGVAVASWLTLTISFRLDGGSQASVE